MSRIIKNYLYNASYQILLMILPIVTTPYVSRVLLPSGVGKYNYAFSIASVAVIIAQLGTNMYGQREIAYVQSDKQKRSIVFFEVFTFRFITVLIVLPIYLLLSYSIKEYSTLLLTMSIYIVANIIDVSWYFQGLEDFKKTAIRGLAVKIVGLILVFLLVKEETDLLMYTVILAGSLMLGNLVLATKLPASIELVTLKELHLLKHIKPILELFLPTAAMYVYTYVDKIFLGVMSSDVAVGYYSQSEKIVKLLMTMITSLGVVLLPHIAASLKDNNYEQIKNELKNAIAFVFGLGLPMVVGAFVIAERFVPWFLGAEFLEAVVPFKVLVPLIMIIGFTSIVGQAVLIPLKKQKIYTISILAGASINVVCNLLLIPNLGALGACIGTVLAELTVTLIQFFAVRRCIGITGLDCIQIGYKYAISAVMMGMVLMILDIFLPKNICWMFVMIVVGILAYAVCLLILKDKMLIRLLRRKK